MKTASPAPLALTSGRSGRSSPEDGDGPRSTVPRFAILAGQRSSSTLYAPPKPHFPTSRRWTALTPSVCRLVTRQGRLLGRLRLSVSRSAPRSRSRFRLRPSARRSALPAIVDDTLACLEWRNSDEGGGRHVEVLDSGAAGVGLGVGRRLRDADCAPGVERPGAAAVSRVRPRDVHCARRRGCHGPARAGGRLRLGRPLTSTRRTAAWSRCVTPGAAGIPSSSGSSSSTTGAGSCARLTSATPRAPATPTTKPTSGASWCSWEIRSWHHRRPCAFLHRRRGLHAIDCLTATATVWRTRSERWPRHQAARYSDHDSIGARHFSNRSLRAYPYHTPHPSYRRCGSLAKFRPEAPREGREEIQYSCWTNGSKRSQINRLNAVCRGQDARAPRRATVPGSQSGICTQSGAPVERLPWVER